MELQSSNQGKYVNPSAKIIRELSVLQHLKKSGEMSTLYKILIQTLNNLGYRQSAETLEKETGVIFFDSELSELQKRLNDPSLREIGTHETQLLESIIAKLPEIQKKELRFLLFQLNLTLLSQYEKDNPEFEMKLISLIQEYSASSEELPKHLETHLDEIVRSLLIDGPIFKPRQVLVKQIVKRCERTGIPPDCVSTILKQYLKNRRTAQGTLFDFLDQPNHASIESKTQLPQLPLSSPLFNTKHEILFLKLNASGTLLATGGNSSVRAKNNNKKQAELTLWRVKQASESPNNNYEHYIIDNKFLKDTWLEDLIWHCPDHNGLTYNQFEMKKQQKEFLITVLSSKITIWDSALRETHSIEVPDMLCCAVNPRNNNLYAAGLFNKVHVWDTQRQEVDVFKSPKIRNMFFNHSGSSLYTVWATKPKITKYQTIELKDQCSQELSSSILHCTLGSSNMLATLKDEVVVLSAESLEIIMRFKTNPYSQVRQFYAYSKQFSNGWIITCSEKETFLAFKVVKQQYGQPNQLFGALHQAPEATNKVMFQNWKSQSSYPIFDVVNQSMQDVEDRREVKMVSAKDRSVIFWKSGIQVQESNSGENREQRAGLMEEEGSQQQNEEEEEYLFEENSMSEEDS